MPYRSPRLLLLTTILLSLPQLAFCDTKKERKDRLQGLIIAGGCCHDYPNQVQIVAQGMAQRIHIEFDVVREGVDRNIKVPFYNKKDWIKAYDVVIHNECYGGVTDVDFVEAIARAHGESGVAAVVIHCSMHSYRNAKTDEWRKLLGVTSRRHEKGGRRLDVTRRMDHPITKGFPETWKTPNGELYVIEKVWPNTKVLATAYGIDTKKDQPCIWTNQYGKARVFGTTLGHHNETMLSDVWLDTVARGVLWSVGKLDEDGTAAEGYGGTGRAEINLLTKPKGKSGSPTLASWSASVKFPKKEKPQRLFNGKNFAGWEGNTDKYFSIEKGEIVARNSAKDAPAVSNYLLTKKKYRNFRLVYEGKLAKSKMHSGIAIWGRKYETGGEPFSYQGHLVMFPSNWGFWDLYRRNSIYRDDGRAKKADNKDWNRMEILAIGDRIRLAVNGKLVADWKDPRPELCGEGPIGLQLHSNRVAQEVRFRGLILSENPEDRMITVKP